MARNSIVVKCLVSFIVLSNVVLADEEVGYSDLMFDAQQGSVLPSTDLGLGVLRELESLRTQHEAIGHQELVEEYNVAINEWQNLNSILNAEMDAAREEHRHAASLRKWLAALSFVAAAYDIYAAGKTYAETKRIASDDSGGDDSVGGPITFEGREIGANVKLINRYQKTMVTDRFGRKWEVVVIENLVTGNRGLEQFQPLASALDEFVYATSSGFPMLACSDDLELCKIHTSDSQLGEFNSSFEENLMSEEATEQEHNLWVLFERLGIVEQGERPQLASGEVLSPLITPLDLIGVSGLARAALKGTVRTLPWVVGLASDSPAVIALRARARMSLFYNRYWREHKIFPDNKSILLSTPAMLSQVDVQTLNYVQKLNYISKMFGGLSRNDIILKIRKSHGVSGQLPLKVRLLTSSANQVNIAVPMPFNWTSSQAAAAAERFVCSVQSFCSFQFGRVGNQIGVFLQWGKRRVRTDIDQTTGIWKQNFEVLRNPTIAFGTDIKTKSYLNLHVSGKWVEDVLR